MNLETPRLILQPCLPSQILALIEKPEHPAELPGLAAAARLREMYTGGDVSPTWVESLRAAAEPDPWRHGFFVIQRETRSVIGMAGFKGPPDPQGVVEIAYGIAPGFRDEGYATEAAEALTALAVRTAGVVLVRAHTLPEPNASTRVLVKCGFRHVASVVDPEDGPVWRWERTP